jgi:tetratricopeptide (TPR) repeat protein
LSSEDLAELAPARRKRLSEQLDAAAGAYRRHRYADAARMSRAILREIPAATSARELLGLSLYKQQKWGAALRELEEFSEQTGSVEQYPVMADCARAQKHYKKVKQYWDELRRAAPSPELMAEGRMVMAGSLVDQGNLKEAFSLMEPSGKSLRSPKEYHLRQWYVLADVLERMGEFVRARRMFERIAQHDAKFSDVSARIRSLK